MVGNHTILHIIELLAAVVCAHHFWPKGITYGEQEDWEKKLHHVGSKAKAKAKGKSSSSHTTSGHTARGRERRGDGREKEHGRVRRRDRERDREDRDFDEVRGERRAYGGVERAYGDGDRDYEYEYEDRPPRYSDRGGARSVY
ncbi:hypothetical protein LARI1_G002993 [Lachnellula arida]|uniref:Uncharacterized protein n=1 Tax=Lachnellula arida TaxID=1316785 RepID=A0A8T9BJ97_9HELO|nr:hypothetical protein LARI1_G002993 [Lachnellula arida]